MIHQPFQIFETILMTILGVFNLARSVGAFRKRQMGGLNGAWATLAVGTFWTWDAVSHFSEAFDWPDQTSHRSNVIYGVGLALLCVVTAPSCVAAWHASRRSHADKATSPVSHGQNDAR